MNRHSLYTRMVLFGCAISIVPLLALGFFSYQKSSASIQNHVNESNIQIMNQMNNNIEQALRTVDYTLNYVINTNLLQEALYKPLTYYDFQLYNKLKEELSLLQSPDTRVTDVILANAASDWVVNNRGLYTFEGYSSKDTLLTLMNLPGGTNWVTLQTGELSSSDTQSYGCSYTIALVKKMPLNTSRKRGVALATIPNCSLAAMMDTNNGARDVVVLDPDFRIIVHPDQKKVGTLLADAGYVNKEDLARFSGRSGQFQTMLDNRPISVTYVRSSFNGWIYASFTELSEYTKESRSIGWFTFYVCALIIGLTVLLVWLGSRRVYSPIRQIFQVIAERLPGTDAIKKNELQVIDEHIRELFASNSKLRSELHQHSQQLRTFFLNKLYQGSIGQSEIEENIELFGLAEQTARWEHLAVITVQIDLLGQSRYDRKDADLLLFAMGNMMEEMIPASDRLPPVILDQTQVILIGCGSMTPEEFNDYVYKLTEQIQQNMQAYLQLDVSIGISLPFRQLHKAPRAYREGLEALKHRLKLGKGVIIPYFSINSGKHTRVYFYPKQIENELIDAIKLADEARSCELMEQWLGEVLQKERSPHEYQISLIRLLNDLMVVMQESGIPVEQLGIQEGSLYEELLKLYVGTEIENWFKSRLIIPMTRVFRDRQESQYQNLSEQIIEIVRKEYDTDLTLEECASRLHYNAFYLSSVFKKETNMSFSEYLSQYRFNMAKRWLVETDMPIKDIAEKLTYNNPQNFIRSFRKQEDMTPGQYRSKYGKASG